MSIPPAEQMTIGNVDRVTGWRGMFQDMRAIVRKEHNGSVADFMRRQGLLSAVAAVFAGLNALIQIFK